MTTAPALDRFIAHEGIELARGGVILLGRGAVLAHNES